MWGDDESSREYAELLAHFSAHLREASELRTTDPSVPLSMKLAVIGYSLHADIETWSIDEYEYVNRFFTEDPKLVGFNRIKGCEEGFAAFAALCLGSLCGQHVAGTIDQDGVARGEWTLVAFLSQHNEEICRKYTDFASKTA
jgi:hypothetical protein